MTTYERRQTILRLLQLEPNETLGVTELAEALEVSEGTIRNDLTALQDEQLIVRVRGGAVLKNGAGATRLPNATRNAEAKLWIARWAADMIEDGDAIFVDASTTVLSIAPFLADRRNLTVITNGIDAARALALNLSNTVILVGGVLRPDGNSVADSLIAQKVDLVIEYQIDEGIGSLLVDKFQRAGIPLIAVDIPMVGASFFGVDNYRAGHMAGIALGEWIAQAWGGIIDRVLVLEESRAGTLPAARIQGQINGL